MKRVFLIVLDSFGIGAAPDAHRFGDEGANTLLSLYKTGNLSIPTLLKMGFGNIDGIDYLKKEDAPISAVGRLTEISLGKDTTVGHLEIAGIYSDTPMKTYPDGFGEDILNRFSEITGRGILCNKPYSGTEVIKDYAKEHERTGKLIVYTSADSVFQIAANEAVIPPDTLYEYCAAAKKILVGENSVGRVIARPYIKENGEYKRTANRRDFSLPPPKPTLLDSIKDAGLSVISVGKINDIFTSQGITRAIPSHSNEEGMQITKDLASEDFSGLAFINLVDFDSKYGHRQDAEGYKEAINKFDLWLSDFLKCLRADDTLIITADHGCDPSDSSTDHTREYVPLLVYGEKIKKKNLGTLKSFSTVAGLIRDILGVSFTPDCYTDISGEILE